LERDESKLTEEQKRERLKLVVKPHDNSEGATAEYSATIIVQDSTCAHIFKERDMCRNKLTQVAGYSAVKPTGRTVFSGSFEWPFVLLQN